MTVITNNSITGINSITAQAGTLNFYDTNGGQISIGASITGDVTGNVTGNVTGDIVIGAGSTSAPSLAPSGDSNTGIFFPSADTIAFAEGGAEAARIDSSGRFGLGTNSFSGNEKLNVSSSSGNTAASIKCAGGSSYTASVLFGAEGFGNFGGLEFDDANARFRFYTAGNRPLLFSTDSTERARIDSSGRLLVGISSARSNYRWAEVGSDYSPSYQVEGSGVNANQSISITNVVNDNYPPILFLGKSRGTSVGSNTVVPDGERIGQIVFAGNDGTRFLPAARIEAVVDGTPGANDMPGRLVFSTTVDGSSDPTERMRIASNGRLTINTASQSTQMKRNDAASGSAIIEFQNSSTTVAYIRLDGGLANVQSNDLNLSDEREKKNIVNLDSTWDCLKHWELKKFHYNDQADTEDKKYGVIAQQIAPHCPEVIDDWVKQEAKEAELDSDGNVVTPAQEEIVRMGVKEQQMYWMAIKALQEAQTRIEELETQNAAILARLDAAEI